MFGCCYMRFFGGGWHSGWSGQSKADKADEILSRAENISNAAVVLRVENLTHPVHPMNRDEISLTCPFRTCQRRMQCFWVRASRPPGGLRLVAWGQTPQVEVAAITEDRAAPGGPVTIKIPLRVSLGKRRAQTHAWADKLAYKQTYIP